MSLGSDVSLCAQLRTATARCNAPSDNLTKRFGAEVMVPNFNARSSAALSKELPETGSVVDMYASKLAKQMLEPNAH
eukprot:CAMPEP_0180480134 /NCGR_PEP_ID=MMETSP1036_2-20121128/33669_1 /TAXON_ID=632150 /ORGANISM="Azadinium spinosum, Strain 3D9" /LENGTH=76 /DNA_ID=CAMNT_0022487739 /DNA_START=388 /DNA_END=618 /DNA_ORIENTATION=+